MSHSLDFGASLRTDHAPSPAHWRPIAGPYSNYEGELLRRAVAQLRGCRYRVHTTPDGDTVIFRHIEEFVDRKPEPQLEAR